MKIIHLKILFSYFLLHCLCIYSFAQTKPPSYNIKNDKPWIDSINRIIKKGFVYEENDKNNPKKQLKYFNSCYTLGKYYEKLYDKKLMPDTKKAIYHYEKVTNFGRFPDNEKYFQALALRNVLKRRLASIYFDGKGVKKDKKKSFEYALTGSSGYKGFYKSYALRYYGTTSIFVQPKIKFDYKKDTVFIFKITPLAWCSNMFNEKMTDKEIREIAKSFLEWESKDSKYNLELFAAAAPTMRSQSQGHFLLSWIKAFYVDRFGIKADKISSTVDVIGDLEPGTIRFSFKKK